MPVADQLAGLLLPHLLLRLLLPPPLQPPPPPPQQVSLTVLLVLVSLTTAHAFSCQMSSCRYIGERCVVAPHVPCAQNQPAATGINGYQVWL